jgi:CRISPR-associated endonuclease/helicase Cas3
VQRAQRLFLELKAHPENRERRVLLLHSRFTTEQRRALAEEIERELGPDQWVNGTYSGRDIIVVATQVVEVGLDISVRTLHTEIAPANSLIQRAGRCARFAQQQGMVIVYPLPDDDEGKPATTLPYPKTTCEATWLALENFHDKTVGFSEEQHLIDAVHTTDDEAMLEQYTFNKGLITDSIFQSLNNNDRSVVSTLIRDVTQVQIIIHDDPNEAITTEPWKWQSFALHPGSLVGRWRALQERQAALGLDWMCKKAVANDKEDDPENRDSRQKTTYHWDEVTNPRGELFTALAIVLPSQLASYDDEVGFVLRDDRSVVPPGGFQSSKRDEPAAAKKNYGSRQQSYQEHIQGLVAAYKYSIRDDLCYIARKLEHQMKLPEGMIDQAICLAIACHDLGKLDRKWQLWAREWQQLVYSQPKSLYRLPDQNYFFAKTDFDYSPAQRELQKQVKNHRPHHACESVMLGIRLIAESLEVATNQERRPVLTAICGAIARHHTSQASHYGVTTLDAAARTIAEEAIQSARLDAAWSYDIAKLDLHISKEGDLAPANVSQPRLTRPASGLASELETWLYFIIVRALRLADQRADLL